MDFSAIKQGFAAYLENKNTANKSAKKYETEATDFNIFRYSNEFKDYISAEYNSDESIKSMSMSEILDLELVGGKLVNPEKIEDYENALKGEDNLTETTDADAVQAEGKAAANPTDAEAVEGSEEQPQAVVPETAEEAPQDAASLMTDILNEFIEDDAIKAFIDTDGNGELDAVELSEFIYGAKDIDGNSDDLSLDDLFGAAEIISEINKLNEPEKESDKVEEPKEAEEEKAEVPVQPATPAQEEQPSQNSVSGGNNSSIPATGSNGASNAGGSQGANSSSGNWGGSSGGTSNAGGSSAANAQSQEKTLDNMSKTELENELKNVAEPKLTEANTSLDTAKEALDTLQTEKESKLDELKTKYDEELKTKYDEYQNKLKEKDEKLAQQVDENKAAIEAKEQEIAEADNDITAKESALAEAERNLSSATANKKAAENSLNSLKAIDTSKLEDSEKASLSSKISAAQSALEKAGREEAAANDAKVKAEEELEAAKQKKLDLEENDEDSLKALKEKKSELEREVMLLAKADPELQAAFDAYNQVSADYEAEKATLETEYETKINDAKTGITDAEAAVTEASKYVDDVKVAISNAKDKEVAKEYKKDEYDEDMASTIADLAKETVNRRGTHGRCLAGVSDVIAEMYGGDKDNETYRLGLYAADAADRLAGTYSDSDHNYAEISSHFKEVDVPRSELTSLPEGYIVVWERNNSSEGAKAAGHICITDGNGGEYSDHHASNMYYTNSNVGYRVFMPIG